MSSIHGDYHSAIKLVVYEHRYLTKLDKDNELLGLLMGVTDDGFTRTRDFSRRYDPSRRSAVREGGEETSNVTISLGNYYKDLHSEVTHKLREIIRDFKDTLPRNNDRGELEKELEGMLENWGLLGAVRTHVTHNRVSLMDC